MFETPSSGDAGRMVGVGCGIFLELPLNETTGLLEFGILEKKSVSEGWSFTV